MRDEREELCRLIAAMPGGCLAAKVRQLMPIIDRQIREERVRHKDIVTLLNAHSGFPRPLTIHHFRWILADFRRRCRSGQVAYPADVSGEVGYPLPEGAGVPVSTAIPLGSNGNTGDGGGERRATRSGTSGVGERVSSKADLKRLRSMDVDLEALAKLAKEE